MIEADNIGFNINARQILNGVSMKIGPGEICGVIGKAGSGKTALLKILSGEIGNYTGDLFIKPNYMRRMSGKELREKISAFKRRAPENQDDSVYNFVLLSRLFGRSVLSPFSEEDRAAAESALTEFGLTSQRDMKLSEISDSTLMSAMLAHAFARRSEILILDEPCSGLDLNSMNRLAKAISKYTINGNRCAVVATNDLNFICQAADRIFIMDDGRISETIKPKELDSDLIKKYFSVDVIISRNIYNGMPEIHIFSSQ